MADEKAQSAWREYRQELMVKIKQPGQRPWAFFRFDLKVAQHYLRPLEQVELLDVHSLLDRDEQFRIEKFYPLLDPDQAPERFSGYHLTYGVGPRAGGALKGNRYLLRTAIRDLEIARHWHKRRARALAEKFERLAGEAWEYLADLEARGLAK